MDQPRKTFGDTLKRHRSQLSLSRQQLSRATKIPVRTLEDWESDRRTPPEYVQFMVLWIIRFISDNIEN